jgi:hypothetical protein
MEINEIPYCVDLTHCSSPKERVAGTRTSAQATPLLRRGAGGEGCSRWETSIIVYKNYHVISLPIFVRHLLCIPKMALALLKPFFCYFLIAVRNFYLQSKEKRPIICKKNSKKIHAV